ncbi:Heat shock 70 kDa protein 17-like [Abeliophyllum distichum]|uniref:Heat shock 70 kDa protein 17-like n=1 Tax=Abeliophyllum distichum TaxID=126358 RepID=A0ABD1Q383_9LAMI
MVAMILKYAMGLVENHARSSVKDVVITVPPYMGVAERRGLLTAADLAGINVLALVNEHFGAALQYGIDKDFLNGTRPVMFYNMGSMHTDAYIYISLEAELRAILDGIILAQRLGLSVLWVESDSTLAIHCITKGGGPWHIQATIRHIRHLLTLDRDTITHIYREGNQVADLLASEGWDRRCYHEYSSQDLSRRHRSLVQIDRFGLPAVRGL